ncbi:unnamed protein product [Rotaria sp. Silwood2]|nr:unnamed protein product [Rotaria sp. Silwood2]
MQHSMSNDGPSTFSTCNSNDSLNQTFTKGRITAAIAPSLSIPGVDIVIYENVNLYHHYNMVHNNGLSQDAQGRWWEILSPTGVRTEQASQVLKKKSKCHGNQKLQHFKGECRVHGMTVDEIKELIHRRHNDHPTDNINSLVEPNSNNNHMKKCSRKKKNQMKKRKRSQLLNEIITNDITKSLSQISIS